MGRAPCCDKDNVRKGPWSREEDAALKYHMETYGNGGNWITLPTRVGLKRCGKSCRLRWMNYLRPDIRHGSFTPEEEEMIIRLHANHGSKWSYIASRLEGRTDNDIKNFWNTKLKKKVADSTRQKMQGGRRAASSPMLTRVVAGESVDVNLASMKTENPQIQSYNTGLLTEFVYPGFTNNRLSEAYGPKLIHGSKAYPGAPYGRNEPTLPTPNPQLWAGTPNYVQQHQSLDDVFSCDPTELCKPTNDCDAEKERQLKLKLIISMLEHDIQDQPVGSSSSVNTSSSRGSVADNNLTFVDKPTGNFCVDTPSPLLPRAPKIENCEGGLFMDSMPVDLKSRVFATMHHGNSCLEQQTLSPESCLTHLAPGTPSKEEISPAVSSSYSSISSTQDSWMESFAPSDEHYSFPSFYSMTSCGISNYVR